MNTGLSKIYISFVFLETHFCNNIWFSLQLVPRETRGEFRKMFRSYFKLISAHLQSERRSMNERERRNLQILQNKGELSEERRTGNENAQKAYDKLLTNTNALAVSG